MTTLALLAGAVVLGWLVPRPLARLAAPDAPRVVAAAWVATATATVLSVAFAALSLVFSSHGLADLLVDLVRACRHHLDATYGDGAGSSPRAGVAALAALAVGVGAAGASVVVRRRAQRRRHRASLELLATPLTDDVVVVAHSAPLAYGIPGRRRLIVLTSAVLTMLDPNEVAAVVEHERAHLRGSHAALLTYLDVLCRAMPFVPVLRAAREQVGDCLEMLADDAAASRCEPAVVASALLALSADPAPEGLVAAGGAGASRIARLLVRRSVPRRTRVGAPGAVFASLALPLMLLGGPAVAAFHRHVCPPEAVALTRSGSDLPVLYYPR